MTGISRLLFLILLIAGPVMANPTAPSIAVSVTPNVGTIGDRFLYQIKHPIDTTIQTKITKESFHPFVITKQDQKDTQIQWELTVFETGQLRIPSQNIQIYFNGQHWQVEVPAQVVMVQSVLPATGNIALAPLSAPFKIERSWQNLWIWLAIMVLGLATFMGWRYWKQKQKQEAKRNQSQEKGIHPFIVAENKLKKLKHEHLNSQENIDAHYDLLSHHLKEGVSRLYHCPALEMTSQELLRYLKKTRIDSAIQTQWRDVMAACDAIKFAKQDIEQHQEILNKAFKLAQAMQGIQP